MAVDQVRRSGAGPRKAQGENSLTAPQYSRQKTPSVENTQDMGIS